LHCINSVSRAPSWSTPLVFPTDGPLLFAPFEHPELLLHVHQPCTAACRDASTMGACLLPSAPQIGRHSQQRKLRACAHLSEETLLNVRTLSHPALAYEPWRNPEHHLSLFLSRCPHTFSATRVTALALFFLAFPSSSLAGSSLVLSILFQAHAKERPLKHRDE